MTKVIILKFLGGSDEVRIPVPEDMASEVAASAASWMAGAEVSTLFDVRRADAAQAQVIVNWGHVISCRIAESETVKLGAAAEAVGVQSF
jgi:hypothetical protein